MECDRCGRTIAGEPFIMEHPHFRVAEAYKTKRTICGTCAHSFRQWWYNKEHQSKGSILR